MSFYQAMQLGAINLKPLIKETEDKKLKQKYITAFVLKNILCLLFCIFVVSSFSNIFGNENSVVASISTPIVKFVINFISIMAIVILSCHNVVLSNQSILVLSYLLLYGYQVDNINVYISRVCGLALGGIIVAGVFYIKQRKVKFENKLSDVIKDVNFNNDRAKWHQEQCG